jgi:hypothetical protein
MSQNGIPDDANSPPESPHHTGILDAAEQLVKLLLHRQPTPFTPPAPDPIPVVEHRLASPPYAGIAQESERRYQQEVFGVRLNAAGPAVATFNVRTRCDFYTLSCYPAGAVAPDANDGVWVALSGTPPSIPTLTPGVVQATPLHLDCDGKLTIHGAEQTLSFTLDSTIDLVVLVTCNTNVHSPY